MKPTDVPGECNAHCYVGDDWGDNSATFRCSLPAGHAGRHREKFRRGTAALEWERDERCYHDVRAELDDISGEWYCGKCLMGERAFELAESDAEPDPEDAHFPIGDLL